MNEITTVRTEQLNKVDFPKQEVLKEQKQINQRKDQAQRAMMRGNTNSCKVKIVFEDKEGKKMLESSVWGVTDRYMLLKNGISLPLHRIHEITI